MNVIIDLALPLGISALILASGLLAFGVMRLVLRRSGWFLILMALLLGGSGIWLLSIAHSVSADV